MAKMIEQFDVLISCPSDLQDLVDSINGAVDKFNETYTNYLGIQLKTRYWKTDSYPKSGGRPQGLLNEILVDSCDAAIAVFWTKFGTPTGEFGSGTEEEIQRMLQGDKQVFLYFSEMDIPYGETIDPRVENFKESYSQKGLYWTFKDVNDFEEMLFAHLSQHFLNSNVSQGTLSSVRPKLKISGIDSGSATEAVRIEDFRFLGHPSDNEMLRDMDKLIDRIKSIKISKKSNIADSPFTAAIAGSSVKFEEDTREIIKQYCQNRSIECDDDFFDLGNLRESIIPITPLGGRSLDGSDEEIEKYNSIVELKDAIYNFLKWTKYESAFDDARCIRLALVNEGRAPDRNIDVLLRIPKEGYVDPFSFEEPPTWVEDYIIYDCNLNDLFSNPTGPSLYQYPGSATGLETVLPTRINGFDIGNDSSYKDELAASLRYVVHDQEDDVIIAVHFPSIKQHTGIVFPSPVFVSTNLRSIEYEITSDNLPEIVKGSLQILRKVNDAEE